MTEKILKIEEVSDYLSGFKITTTEQEILVLINTEQDCYELSGYIVSDDDLDKYIGAELINLSVTFYSEADGFFQEMIPYDLDEGDACFVDLKTNKGTLVFAVYNSHNGYYGHSIKIKSNKFNVEEYI